MRPRRAISRPGLTLLEVVLATALLGIAAAMVLGTLSAIWGWQARQEQALGAAEMANRLMLTFLDDRTILPSQSLPVEYGPYRYRWSLDRTAVKVADPPDLPADVAQKRAERAARGSLDRIEHISIRVWLSEESGGTLRPQPSTPQVVLERLVDPIVFRNPDSIKKMMAKPALQGEILGGMFARPPSRDQNSDKDKDGGR